MQTKFMTTNAFSSLVIDGLIKINDVHMPLTCFRGISKPPKTLLAEEEHWARAGGPPARPPSELPPQGDLCLHVSLNPERLGYGRVGCVYSLNIDDPNTSFLPPLVMKVAARHRSENLAREAWFYEEMERIQGASIARCYGIFTAEIDPNYEVLDWAESDEDYDPNEIDHLDGDDDEIPDIPSPEPQFWDDNDPEPWDPKKYLRPLNLPEPEETTTQSSSKKPNYTDPQPESNSDKKTLVSVLVLERLGEMLPMDVPLESFKPDIQEIYSDLGQFGVEQMDVRWRNILAAPSTYGGLVCPYHGHRHEWRVVDFDRARKSDFKQSIIDSAQNSHLRRVFRGLPEGFVIEPWD